MTAMRHSWGIGSNLAEALEEQGLLPPECVNVEVRVALDSVMVLHYEVRVTEADLPKLAAAFQKLADARSGSGVLQDGSTPERMRG